MTKDEIIKEVTTNKEYFRICKRILAGHPTHKDLYQELLLILLEYNEEKFARIPDLRQTKFFIIGILCRMAHSKTSPFYFKYKTTSLFEEGNNCDLQDDYDFGIDEKIIATEKAIEQEHWFNKELLKLYIEYGSYTKIENATKIDRSFSFRKITETKERIKHKLKKVKILLIAQKENNALKYHRQIIPHTRLVKTNAEEIQVTMKLGGDGQDGKHYESTIDDMTDEELSNFNVIYFLRQLSFNGGREKEIVDRCHKAGVKVILDIDDNWRLNSQHLMYELYKEKTVVKNTETALKYVDHVITTTDFFADDIRKFNSNVTVIPNCISPDDKQFEPRQIENKRIRFGWIGGVYHKEDIESMDSTFCRMAKDKEIRDSYQICLGGFNYDYQRNRPNPEYKAIETTMTCNYEFKHYDSTYLKYLYTYTPTMEHISFDKSYRRLWSRDIFNYGNLYNEIDVALVPLRPNKFNGCKSELKLVEAGWMGKAVIVSDVLPYSKWIKHGVNGFKVNPNRNNIDWYLCMKKLIQEPEMRKDMAMALQETIKENFDIDKWNKVRLNLYKNLI